MFHRCSGVGRVLARVTESRRDAADDTRSLQTTLSTSCKAVDDPHARAPWQARPQQSIRGRRSDARPAPVKHLRPKARLTAPDTAHRSDDE